MPRARVLIKPPFGIARRPLEVALWDSRVRAKPRTAVRQWQPRKAVGTGQHPGLILLASKHRCHGEVRSRPRLSRPLCQPSPESCCTKHLLVDALQIPILHEKDCSQLGTLPGEIELANPLFACLRRQVRDVSDHKGLHVEENIRPRIHLREEPLDEDRDCFAVAVSLDKQNQALGRSHSSLRSDERSLQATLVHGQQLARFQEVLPQALQLFGGNGADLSHKVPHFDYTDLFWSKLVKKLGAVCRNEDLSSSLAREALELVGQEAQPERVNALFRFVEDQSLLRRELVQGDETGQQAAESLGFLPEVEDEESPIRLKTHDDSIAAGLLQVDTLQRGLEPPQGRGHVAHGMPGGQVGVDANKRFQKVVPVVPEACLRGDAARVRGGENPVRKSVTANPVGQHEMGDVYFLNPGQGTEHELSWRGRNNERRRLDPFPLSLVVESLFAKAQFLFQQPRNILFVQLLEPQFKLKVLCQ